MHRTPLALCLPLIALVLGTACMQYSEPPPPRDVHPVSRRNADMAMGGLDMAHAGPGRAQRSGMSGTTGDTDDNEHLGMQMGSPGAETSGAEGTGTIGLIEPRNSRASGRGETDPGSDLEDPEMMNGQVKGQVFRPSDHYFINGTDTGPSVDAMPGTGGPPKMKMKQRY